MAKFEAPGIKKWDFMTVWILKKLRRFVWNKLLESKALLLSIISRRYPLNFPKIQTDVLIYSLTARDLKLDHFGIFGMFFPFLAFFKL